MVVDDFDFGGACVRPDKEDPELVVDSDRVLSLAIANQRLKAIAGRRSQVAKNSRRIEVTELSACDFHQICRKSLRTFAAKDGFRDFVPEVPDHRPVVSSCD